MSDPLLSPAHEEPRRRARNVRLTFPGGTSEIHRLLVGRSALGLDAFR